jgi:hypothetical protein
MHESVDQTELNETHVEVAFWRLPFERAQFSSDDEMHERFLQTLHLLLSSRVRVIQRRVGAVYDFIGEIEDVNGRRALGGVRGCTMLVRVSCIRGALTSPTSRSP